MARRYGRFLHRTDCRDNRQLERFPRKLCKLMGKEAKRPPPMVQTDEARPYSARFALLSTLLPLRRAAQFQQADFFLPREGQLFADASASSKRRSRKLIQHASQLTAITNGSPHEPPQGCSRKEIMLQRRMSQSSGPRLLQTNWRSNLSLKST